MPAHLAQNPGQKDKQDFTLGPHRQNTVMLDIKRLAVKFCKEQWHPTWDLILQVGQKTLPHVHIVKLEKSPCFLLWLLGMWDIVTIVLQTSDQITGYYCAALCGRREKRPRWRRTIPTLPILL